VTTVDLTPDISKVRALVTTRWGNGGYTPRTMRGIQEYFVDSALDTDTDQWSLQIADPHLEMSELLERDNEVRVQLYGAGGTGYILTGIADEVNYTEEGTHTLTGRDLSALAVDSMVEPGVFRHIRADRLVGSQAKKIGFARTSLASTGPNGPIVKKLQRTDGSETYWEFWYRLYRREKMWIWTEPNGLLVANTLNYKSPPAYFFGTPARKDSNRVADQYIPIESLSMRKTTTGRWEEIWVGGHRGTRGFWRKANDPTLRGWKMKRRKFIVDNDAHTWSAAIKAAWEEIFENKVGAVEIALTVLDPGFLIRQNTIAKVNIPQIGLIGEFFVVGSRIQGGPDGFMQEIRLRQRNYAITRRIPDAPDMPSASQPPQTAAGASAVNSQLAQAVDMPAAWGDYFTKAAKKWCGPWDYNLFLAALLAMCEKESGFRNIRQHMSGLPGDDNVVWYPRPAITRSVSAGVARAEGTTINSFDVPATQTHWEQTFANEPGVYGINSPYIGVGPMQLTSIGLKHEADDMLRENFRNQFEGGRWHPEYNIMVSAHYLRQCLQIVAHDSGRDIDIWGGVAGYNGGPGNPNYVYSEDVRSRVMKKFLPAIQTARDKVREASKFDPGDDHPSPDAHVNPPSELARLTWITPRDSNVNLAHVNYNLLQQVNAVGKSIFRVITINSGWRDISEQRELYRRYKAGLGPRAANPDVNPSNHQLGEALDVVVNFVGLRDVVGRAVLAKYHLAANISDEPWHVTRDSIPNAGH
jgi:prophage tail gpP-like protein/uncharacterized protein YcbK (DUF882 family)